MRRHPFLVPVGAAILSALGEAISTGLLRSTAPARLTLRDDGDDDDTTPPLVLTRAVATSAKRRRADGE